MVDVGWRRSRRKTADRGDRSDPLGQAAISYATLGWPVCAGAHLSADGLRPGRACSCDRVGCPAPGAHPVSPTWQMQATVDTPTIQGWWAARPEASVILVTGRVFDVLDIPATAGTAALAADRGRRDHRRPGRRDRRPDAVLRHHARRPDRRGRVVVLPAGLRAGERHHLGRPALALPGQLRAGPAVGRLTRPDGPGGVVGWVRDPADHPLPDALRLLEFLVDACEEAGLS